jgi:hypothetical protein
MYLNEVGRLSFEAGILAQSVWYNWQHPGSLWKESW